MERMILQFEKKKHALVKEKLLYLFLRTILCGVTAFMVSATISLLTGYTFAQAGEAIFLVTGYTAIAVGLIAGSFKLMKE